MKWTCCVAVTANGISALTMFRRWLNIHRHSSYT